MFHRRNWRPTRPIQWTLAHLMIVIALVSLGLGLFRLSMPMRLIVLVSAGMALGPLFLARIGYKLVDIIAVLAIVLLAVGFVLPAMVRTRIQTAGQRTIPITVPASFSSFLFGDR
jgi:hypothetical protein